MTTHSTPPAHSPEPRSQQHSATTVAPTEPGPAPGQLGRTLPSWQLRGWLALSYVIVVASVAAWAELHVFMVTVLLASAAYAAIRPDSHAPTGFLVLAAGVIVFSEAELSAWVLPAVAGFHASHVLAALAALAPWGTAVEYAALRPALRRFVIVQAASQFLVLLALLVSG